MRATFEKSDQGANVGDGNGIKGRYLLGESNFSLSPVPKPPLETPSSQPSQAFMNSLTKGKKKFRWIITKVRGRLVRPFRSHRPLSGGRKTKLWTKGNVRQFLPSLPSTLFHVSINANLLEQCAIWFPRVVSPRLVVPASLVYRHERHRRTNGSCGMVTTSSHSRSMGTTNKGTKFGREAN